MDQIIIDAQNLVNAYTGQTWSPSDENYSKIQTATRLLAASLIYEGLPSTAETKEKAEQYYQRAMSLLEEEIESTEADPGAFKVCQA